MMALPHALYRLVAAAGILGLAACGDSETAPCGSGSGFFNAASEDLDAVEGEHFAGLTFTPASLATVAAAAAVTVQAAP
jgi:hypothetical protein